MLYNYNTTFHNVTQRPHTHLSSKMPVLQAFDIKKKNAACKHPSMLHYVSMQVFAGV